VYKTYISDFYILKINRIMPFCNLSDDPRTYTGAKGQRLKRNITQLTGISFHISQSKHSIFVLLYHNVTAINSCQLRNSHTLVKCEIQNVRK